MVLGTGISLVSLHGAELQAGLSVTLHRCSHCSGSSEVQQILQNPSGHTQTHKTSISLQRDEHTPCESSLGLGMPKAATFNLLKL